MTNSQLQETNTELVCTTFSNFRLEYESLFKFSWGAVGKEPFW